MVLQLQPMAAMPAGESSIFDIDSGAVAASNELNILTFTSISKKELIGTGKNVSWLDSSAGKYGLFR
jgi:hypothetical protein